MNLPNPDLVVDTFLRVRDMNFNSYINQLRSELIPAVRRLQSEGKIVWHSFLLHGQQHLGGRVPATDQDFFVHIRLSLPEGADLQNFISHLPANFEQPIESPLTPMNEFGNADFKGQDWRYAWKMLGEASEWVLTLIESYSGNTQIPINNIIQFLHYITNPLTLGHKCLFVPGGFGSF
jgi:hypothetical protein